MRPFATVMASLLHIRIILAAATVTCMLLGLVFSLGIARVGSAESRPWDSLNKSVGCSMIR